MMPDAPSVPGAGDGSLRHVFVYGTLRAGEVNDINQLRPRPRKIGVAHLPGRLVDLGDYPGLLPDGEGLVFGEVYAIDPALQPVLDLIEGMHLGDAAEYQRDTVVVTVAGQALMCLVYRLRPQLAPGRPSVAGGDWVQYRKSRDAKN